LYAYPREGTVELDLVYAVDLFDAPSMSDLLEQLERVLLQMAAEPARSVADLRLLDEREEARLHERRAVTRVDRPRVSLARGGTVFERFFAQAETRSLALAVQTREHTWDYATLGGNAHRIAGALERRGAAGRVALLFEHGAPMIAAMLGALR